MPKTRRFNPAVRNAPTFGKKKIKLGRQLKHQNATNTSVSAKRIVMMEQLKDGKVEEKFEQRSDVHQQQWKKSVDELVLQIGHHNEHICRDAIHGLL